MFHRGCAWSGNFIFILDNSGVNLEIVGRMRFSGIVNIVLQTANVAHDQESDQDILELSNIAFCQSEIRSSI